MVLYLHPPLKILTRGYFEITQSINNEKLIYEIRNKLGFGNIHYFEREGEQYCR
jgi:hypothetical protein